MDDFQDLLDALPAEEIHQDQIPPARQDATVTVLSLPTEVLQEVAEYSQTRDVLSLMRTNRTFYAVGLRRFYESAYLLGSRSTGFLSKMPESASVEQLVAQIQKDKSHQRKLGVFGGLLCQKRHIAHVKRLVIVDYPNYRHSNFNKLLRHLLEHAILLQTFEMRGIYIHTDVDDFADMQLPFKYLQRITTTDLKFQPMASVVKQVELASLHVHNLWCPVADLVGAVKNSSATLSSLSCYIQLDKNLGVEEAFKQLDELATSIPRVEDMRIGLHESDQEVALQYITRLIQNLHRLRQLTINEGTWSNYSVAKELTMTRACSEANGQLQMLRFAYPWIPHGPANSDAILWKKDNDLGNDLSWTPCPAFPSRWPAWIKMFGTADAARKAMVERWASDTAHEATADRWGCTLPNDQIPSIDRMTLTPLFDTWSD